MKIIEPKVELINPPAYSYLLSLIELAGRTCYKSESKITGDSAEKFVRNILKRGHEAVIEHGSVSVRFTCDRGVSHEIVRHRLASYCQESTRYCNYGKEDFGSEITVIKPCSLDKTVQLTDTGFGLVPKQKKPISICWTSAVLHKRPGLFFPTARRPRWS